MSINLGSINNFSLNSTPSGGSVVLEDILEALGLQSAQQENPYISKDVLESLSLQSSQQEEPYRLEPILEILTYLESYSSSHNSKVSVSESIQILDILRVLINVEIDEGLGFSDISVGIVGQVAAVLENLLINSEALHRQEGSSQVSESLLFSEDLRFGLLKSIVESLGLSETLINRAINTQKILETLNISFTSGQGTALFASIEELMSVDASTSSTAILTSIIEDLINIIVGADKDLEYLSYLLSPETFSVSTYTNYNFTGSCVYSSVPLFINREGLYKYGGDLDIGEDIVASIQTAALSFGSSNLKQVPNIYLGLSNSNSLVLKVAVDGQADILYNLHKRTEGLQTQKISIGKGLIGRYFQFELITQDSTQFELESIEFLPITLKRKL